MIRGSGNIGQVKRDRLDACAGHSTPALDRVQDGRHLLEQDDPLVWFGAKTVRPHPRTHVSRLCEEQTFIGNSARQRFESGYDRDLKQGRA